MIKSLFGLCTVATLISSGAFAAEVNPVEQVIQPEVQIEQILSGCKCQDKTKKDSEEKLAQNEGAADNKDEVPVEKVLADCSCKGKKKKDNKDKNVACSGCRGGKDRDMLAAAETAPEENKTSEACQEEKVA